MSVWGSYGQILDLQAHLGHDRCSGEIIPCQPRYAYVISPINISQNIRRHRSCLGDSIGFSIEDSIRRTHRIGIELDYGKIYRNIFDGKNPWVSCRFSQQNQSIDSVESLPFASLVPCSVFFSGLGREVPRGKSDQIMVPPQKFDHPRKMVKICRNERCWPPKSLGRTFERWGWSRFIFHIVSCRLPLPSWISWRSELPQAKEHSWFGWDEAAELSPQFIENPHLTEEISAAEQLSNQQALPKGLEVPNEG